MLARADGVMDVKKEKRDHEARVEIIYVGESGTVWGRCVSEAYRR